MPGLARLSPPAWAPDPEFDIDFHVRHVELPAPGTERQLLDLAAQLYQEPLDRTRPLWRFVVIDGVEGGRSALWAIVHHAISDGIGQLRMAELYQQVDPNDPPPPEVDLDAVVADAVANHSAKEQGGDLAQGFGNTATKTFGHLVRRQLGVARRAAGEVMIWPADPRRAGDKLGEVAAIATSTVGALLGSGNEVPGGSPLWKQRSRHRQLEWVSVPLDDLKAAGVHFGASINDLFLAGLTEGAVRYHTDRDVAVDAFNTSFVLSTRTDRAIGGNSFTPIPVQVAGAPMSPAERVDDIRVRLAASREAMASGGGMSAVSGIANLLPTSVVTQAARAAAGRIDFATSNLRGAPFTLYVAGARACNIVTMGPVRGHRVQCDRVVVRRAVRHRTVHRPRRHRHSRRLPRRRRVVVRRPRQFIRRAHVSGPVTTDDTGPIGTGPVVTTPTVEITASRVSQVGAFSVQRALPHRTRRTVGAWCFLDHMGPTAVDEHHGLDIGPHPHIGLQTVTWLLDGEALHRDSLGTEQVIAPGQLNLMTAGHGISHSEEATGSYRGRMHGAQLWVAQPEETRHGQPAFEHHAELPRVEFDRAVATILIGSLDGAESPARRDTDHAGFELDLHPGATTMPLRADYEHALVVLNGQTVIDGTVVTPGHLAYLGVGRDELHLTTPTRTNAMLIGGVPCNERLLMWWNYVARTRDEITAAHADWSAAAERFGHVDSPLPRIDTGPPPWTRA